MLIDHPALLYWQPESHIVPQLPELPTGYADHAPDIGYFPDADVVFSDLSHYHRTADLLRNLKKYATTPNEKAFVLGWLSHWLTDCATHPLVNKGVGELLGAGKPVAYEDDMIAHQQVEVGVDAVFTEGNEYRRIEALPCFDSDNIRFVADAFMETYGVRIEPGSIVSSYESVRESGTKLAQLAVIQDNLWRKKLPQKPLLKGLFLELLPLKMLCAVIGRKAPHYALGTLVKPSNTFTNEWKRALNAIASNTIRSWDNGIQGISNRNLDTAVLEENDTYRARIAVLEKLAA